jgi:hypothetical protein
MNHAPNSLSRLTSKHWLAAMEADSSWNLFNPDRSTLYLKDLADEFLTAFGLPAYMTSKHHDLRLVKSYHSAGFGS